MTPAPFTGLAPEYIWNLLHEGTNYITVQSFDMALDSSTKQDAFFVLKDTNGPTITSNQSGDNTWRNAVGTVYNVDFQDLISGTTEADYLIKDGSGNQLFGWTPVFTNAGGVGSYTTDWPISGGAFNALPDGSTGYVYLRSFDKAGNVTMNLTPSFFILKDTDTPTVTVAAQKYYMSSRDFGARNYTNFYDPLVPGQSPGASGLNAIQYYISTATAMSGSIPVKNWTAIPGLAVGTTWFTSNWQIDFASLPGAVTCYVSVSAADLAGNTSTYVDAFRIFRSTVLAPAIVINEAADYNWYGASTPFVSRLHDIDFDSFDNDFISTVTASAYSLPSLGGTQRFADTIIIATGTVYAYTANWPLTPVVSAAPEYLWNLLAEGTNYISLQAYDIMNDSTPAVDAFRVFKDTTPPVISNLMAGGDNTWRNSNSATYNVGLRDILSGLGSADYIIHANSYTGTLLQDWSSINTITIGSTLYNGAPWSISAAAWNAIPEGTTAYVSVRVFDRASVGASQDCFYILKDTTPPTVPVTTAPATNAILASANVNFSWNGSTDTVSHVDHYDIVAATSSDFGNIRYSATVPANAASALLSESTWYWKVRSADTAGNASAYSTAVSFTVSTSAPSGPLLSAPLNGATTNVMLINYRWQPVTAGPAGLAGYEIYLSTASDFSVFTTSGFTTNTNINRTLPSAAYYWQVYARDNAGLRSPSLTYTVVIDTIPPVIVNNQSGDDTWRNSGGTSYNVDFFDSGSGLKNIQYAVWTSSDQTSGQRLAWADIDAVSGQAAYTLNWQLNFAALAENATNYVSVRAIDQLQQYTTYWNAFYVKKDQTIPTVTNNEAGGDATWRMDNSHAYNVTFADGGGSLLGSFEVRITTGANATGTLIQDWTALQTGINAANYSAPWQIPSGIFNAMQQGQNYVSVRVTDTASNSRTITDAFYVLKDTTPPTFTNNQAGDTIWRNNSAGLYDVDMHDVGAGLSGFEVRASSVTDGSAYLTPWTVAVTSATADYTMNWPLPALVWNALTTSVTGYISIRSSDTAGNYALLNNAFFVLKDTVVPTISNNQSGDNVWRRIPDGSYNMDFADLGGSRLQKFQIRSSTVGYGAVPLTFDWTDGGTNITGLSAFSTFYIQQTQFDLLAPGTNYISVRVYDIAGSTAEAVNAFYVLKDTQAPTGIATGPAFYNTHTVPVTLSAFDNGPSGIKYVKLFWTTDTGSPYTWNQFGSTFTSIPINFTVAADGTYGFRVVAFDNAMNSDETDPPPVTLAPETGTLVSSQGPTIVKNVSGDSTWRSASGTLYNIDFVDPVSLIDTAQYVVWTGPANTGTKVKDWTNITASTRVASYVQDWPVDFTALISSVNYVSVRAWNMAGTTTTVVDAFYILKDTTPPSVSGLPSGDSKWRSAQVSYPLTLADNGSLLSNAQYAVFSLPVFGGSSIIPWTAFASGISSSSYSTPLSLDFASLPQAATNYVSLKVTDIAGNITIVTDAFYVLKDTTPPSVVNNQAGDNTWRNTSGTLYDVDFFDNGGSKIDTLQYTVWTATGGAGIQTIPWTAIALGVNTTSYTNNWPVNFSALADGTSNYVSVRAWDTAGSTFTALDVFHIYKDVTGPSIINNQSGDNTWRSISNGFYDVDFQDTIDGVSSFQVRVWSGPGQTGAMNSDWTTVAQNINSFVYSANWQLPSAVFNAMATGKNYVSLRAFDNSSNESDLIDAFYVYKDTLAPTITDNQSGDFTWRNSGGTLYNVDFNDPDSLLLSAQYSAWSAPGQTGTQSLAWSDIASGIYAGTYNADWPVNFDLLSSGTNYISVQVRDSAGNVTVSTNVFVIYKDTVVPAAITDLVLSGGAGTPQGQIRLTWTAPGDDGKTAGPAVSYAVRFATFTINNENDYTAATVFANSWLPGNPNAIENTHSVTGLDTTKTYAVSVRAIDKAGSQGSLSNAGSLTAPGPDTTPPGIITNLSATAGGFGGQIRLTWTAPGNDNYTGTAAYYTLKWSLTPILSISDWNDLTNTTTYIQSWVPQAGGATEDVTLTDTQCGGFMAGTTYYFAICAFDGVNNIINVSNSASSAPQNTAARSGMYAWGMGANAAPDYRFWQPPAWGATNAGVAAIATIRWSKLVSCPLVKNEKLLGLETYDGTGEPAANFYLQRWDGSTNQWSGTAPFGKQNSGTGNLYSTRRCFDIAYEQNSGRALIAWWDATASQIRYEVWSSTAQAMIGGGTLNIQSGASGTIYFIRLEPQPETDRIMLATLDSNSRIFASVWNGPLNGNTGWDTTVSTRTVTTTASVNTRQCYDIAWEADSGRCMVFWGQGTALQYDLWSSTMSEAFPTKNAWLTPAGGNTGPTGASLPATFNWLKLAANPNTTTSPDDSRNYIAMTSADGSNDWNVAIWNGSTWSGVPAEDPTMASSATRWTDLAWEKDTNRCMFVAAHTASTTMSYLAYSQAQGWHNPVNNAAATPLSAPRDTYAFSGAIAILKTGQRP